MLCQKQSNSKFALKTELAKQNIFFWVIISQILEDEEGRACQCEEAVRGQEGREAPENRRCVVMTRSLVCEGQSERTGWNRPSRALHPPPRPIPGLEQTLQGPPSSTQPYPTPWDSTSHPRFQPK